MPAAVFLLGVLAIALLTWEKDIHKKQRANFALANALMDLQIKTATTHLWLEEAFARGKDFDSNVRLVQSNLTDAEALSKTILRGGETEHGLVLQPPGFPALLARAEKISGLMSEIGTLMEKRLSQPATAGPGSDLDERYDRVFTELQGTIKALELDAERSVVRDYAESKRMFFGINFAWLLIVVAATAGLGSLAARKERADVALQNAKDELEVKVAERTRELGNANAQLSRELAERKQAEEALRRSEQEAERQAHLASMGELAAGVAHEINNPVSGIINCAEILVNKTDERSREHDIGMRIIKEGSRIAYIVKSLLSFARVEAEEKAPVPIRDVLADTLALTEAQMKKEGITLRLDIDGEATMVRAQHQQLEQVFLNIINNARDALNQKYPEKEEGKTLSITARRAATDGRPCVRIAFHDQGCGIPENVMNRVMHPFFSTKPKGKGTGLGLSISHGIVENHGGKLTIDSREGAFTDVVVELPLLEKG